MNGDSTRSAETPAAAADRHPGDLGLLIQTADASARAAADRHGLHVVELQDIGEHHAAAKLLMRIWRTDTPERVLSADLIRALAHSGNCVLGVYLDIRLVGVAVAFFGAGHLHSHVTGVDPDQQCHGVGYALKQRQRWWALSRGITEIRWTFDPLVCRNAYFNLHKLGVTARAYLPDFYGSMHDGVNAHDESDRLYVSWRLAPSGDVTPAPTATPTATPPAVTVLDLVNERPVAVAQPRAEGGTALVAVPTDIDALRQADPPLASSWRRAVRTALTGALATGYRITDMRRDGRYVLVKP